MALTPERLEYQRRWRKENPEQYRAQQQRTRISRNAKINSDFSYFVDYTYNSLKSGAKARGYDFKLTKQQLKKILKENQTCGLTGRPVTHQQHDPFKASIDRIDNNKGYVRGNFQVVSSRINRHRLDLPLDQFIEMCLDVAAHQGWKPPVDQDDDPVV